MKFDWRIVNLKSMWSQAEILLMRHNMPLTPAQEAALKNLLTAVQQIIIVFGGKKNLVGMES